MVHSSSGILTYWNKYTSSLSSSFRDFHNQISFMSYFISLWKDAATWRISVMLTFRESLYSCLKQETPSSASSCKVEALDPSDREPCSSYMAWIHFLHLAASQSSRFCLFSSCIFKTSLSSLEKTPFCSCPTSQRYFFPTSTRSFWESLYFFGPQGGSLFHPLKTRAELQNSKVLQIKRKYGKLFIPFTVIKILLVHPFSGAMID